MMQFFLTHNI